MLGYFYFIRTQSFLILGSFVLGEKAFTFSNKSKRQILFFMLINIICVSVRFYVCVNVYHMCACACVGQRSFQIFWIWGYRLFWAAHSWEMWKGVMLGG